MEARATDGTEVNWICGLQVPLKANRQWSQKRAERKVKMLYGSYEAYVRRHWRWTIRLGIGLVLNVVLIIPFFKGMPLHNYWKSIGNPSLLSCLALYIAFLFEGAWTYIHWQSLKQTRQSEWAYLKSTRRLGNGQS